VTLSHLSDLVGRVLASRYRIVAPLGNGASGRVYLADDTQLRRRVAVKVLHEGMANDSAFLKRFRAEAQAAAALNHPNIMHVYDSGADDGVPYLVCEYLGGGSLRAMLDAGDRLTVAQALLVGLDTARGLDYAHRQGLVHRDIKPANLLFGEEGRLRIGDFGLARAIAEAAWTEPQGMLLGTARYAAPEQAQGQNVDGKADVYALGLVLIEAVTGSVPFSADTTMATLMARCEGDVVVPDALGPLVAVLERAGRMEPAERCDAAELEVAFMAAAGDMERPAPLPLVGALPPDDALAIPAGFSAGEPVGSEAVRDDITIVLPASPVRSNGSAAASTSSSTPSVIDIPLDSDPAPVVAVAAQAPPGFIGDVELSDGHGRPFDESVDDDVDVDVDERRRRRWPRLLGVVVVLALIVGGGVVAWLLLRTPSAEVPNLVNRQLATAQAVARQNGWTIVSTTTREDGTRPNQILSQSPAGGTDLEQGHTLRLRVSLGPTLVPMPRTVGQPQQAAIQALTLAGLDVGKVTPANDEKVPKGSVISVAAPVDADGRVPKGSTVDMVVSSGPAPRTVPDGLVGQPVASVKQALAAVQLGLHTTDAYSDQPVGTVLSLSQPAGTTLPRDTVIEAQVSKGPQPVPIPNVAGQSVQAATTTLQNAGFAVSGVEGSPAGQVLATDPPAGEPHQKGTPVRLFTRQ
jgi:serine/threonine-protein kinase